MTSNCENDALTESLDAEDDRDLTGGNLGMIEDVSDLNFEVQDAISEEIAYDIRPNKLQPRNEMVRFCGKVPSPLQGSEKSTASRPDFGIPSFFALGGVA